MPRQHDPLFSKRLVGRLLQVQRDRAGRTQQVVAESMDWSVSKLIRIENATVHISTSDLKALLAEYRVAGDEAEKLVAEAKASRQAPWYATYGDAVPALLRRAIAYESAAKSIFEFQLQGIPGLVQTEAYARAMLAVFLPDEQLDTAVAVRIERQRRLLDDDPPTLNVLLDESVLLRAVGGEDVQREQLEHLMELAERPWLRISVVPLARGGHPGVAGSFRLLDLDPAVEMATVLEIENEHGEDHLSNRDDERIQRYWSRYEDIARLADTGEAAIATLKRCIAQIGHR
jgi:hypothetical protein